MLLFIPCFSWHVCFSVIVKLPGKVTQSFGSKLSCTQEIWVSHQSDENVCKHFSLNSSRFLFSRNYHIVVQALPAITTTYMAHKHTWRGRKRNREKTTMNHTHWREKDSDIYPCWARISCNMEIIILVISANLDVVKRSVTFWSQFWDSGLIHITDFLWLKR